MATVPAEVENLSRGRRTRAGRVEEGGCVSCADMAGAGDAHTHSWRKRGLPGPNAEVLFPVFVSQTRSHGLCLIISRRLRPQQGFLVMRFGNVAFLILVETVSQASQQQPDQEHPRRLFRRPGESEIPVSVTSCLYPTASAVYCLHRLIIGPSFVPLRNFCKYIHLKRFYFQKVSKFRRGP